MAYSLRSSRPFSTHTASSSVIKTKCQFDYRPTRPSPASTCLEFLPPAKFTLSIVSLSYNRPSVHTLLSPSFPSSRAIRYVEPQGLFILSAIPPRFVNLAQPVPDHVRTLNSCFSKEDQERWKEHRARKRRAAYRPIHQLRLTVALRIKDLHKSCLIRKSIRKRWIAALKLIVQYGAHLNHDAAVLNDPQQQQQQDDRIRLDPNQAGFHKWLDPDHYYILHPNLPLNTAGLPQLIEAIRNGLQSIQRTINNTKPSPRHPPSGQSVPPSRHARHQPPASPPSSRPTNNNNPPEPPSNYSSSFTPPRRLPPRQFLPNNSPAASTPSPSSIPRAQFSPPRKLPRPPQK